MRRRKHLIRIIVTLLTIALLPVAVAVALTGDFTGSGNTIRGSITIPAPRTYAPQAAAGTANQDKASGNKGKKTGKEKDSKTYVYPALEQRQLTITRDFEKQIQTPQVQMSPPSGQVAVDKDVFAFSTAATQTITENVEGVTLTITVEPQRFEWDWGDGSVTDSGSDSGAPWPDGTVTHQYSDVGVYRIIGRVHWRATWSVDGSEPEEIPGDIVTESPTRDFEVKYLIPYLTN